MVPQISLIGVPGIGEIFEGDPLDRIILDALRAADLSLRDGDVLVVAGKIISKSEGRVLDLKAVVPSERAVRLSAVTEKEPELVQAILDESTEVSRAAPNVLVVRHRLGFTSANAGIDRSNHSGPDHTVLLLPVDPDRSADALRSSLEAALDISLGVVVADTHGRPFRRGNVGVAIGISGLVALVDKRGEADLYGRVLQATFVPMADQLAGAGALLGGEGAEGLPVVIVRGAAVTPGPGRAADLVRPPEEDLYRPGAEGAD